MAPPPPPPPLADELVEEILLRIPPNDPALLLRAALVCKDWCRIASSAVFRRKFRDLHRGGAPPILGFIRRRVGARTCFSPTRSSSFRPRTADLRGWFVLDSRHGRVLLAASRSLPSMAVWDPITGGQLQLPNPPLSFRWQRNWPFCVNVAVLCAASGPNGGCDHLDCHRGPFLVVLLSTVPQVTVRVYSSEDGAWSEPSYAPMIPVRISSSPWDQNVLAGNALYFTCQANNMCSKILEYDLGAREINWINLPRDYPFRGRPLLFTTAEYGRLGVAIVENSRLRLWSRDAGPDQHSGQWEQGRVIEIGTMLPACNARFISVVGFVPGLDVFLVRTDDDIYRFDVKSKQMRKVCNDRGIENVVPYMSLCTPALGAASSEGASNA